MLLALLFSFASLCIFPSLGQTATITDLVNKGFETCTSGSAPSGWIQGGQSTSTSPLVVCSTDRTHTGTYAARFVPFSVTGTGNKTTYIAELSQTVSFLQGGQPITLSYWVNFADVPVGVDSSTIGTYNFTVTYNNNAASRISIDPQVVPNSATPESNFFYQFVATFNAPQQNYQGGTLTISFQSNQPSINLYVDDVDLTSPTVSGDPQFVGLRGQSYQVHGIDGGVYNLVSSADSQVNARFVFLDHGKCPIFDGIPASNCWAHPGSYLGTIGIQQRVDDHINQLEIVSGSAKQGFASVKLNGVEMEAEDSMIDGKFHVHFDSSHRVTVQTDQFIYLFENSDMFINQAVSPRVPLRQLTSHGLFGQTHNSAVYRTPIKYIEGHVDDYMIGDNNIFGDLFIYNQFTA